MLRLLRSPLAPILIGAATAASAFASDFYDLDVYREIRLSFSQPDWWNQLERNYESKSEIAATMTVDGEDYPEVGVRFRGNTSYRNLPPGSEKKGFNIRLDAFGVDQDLYGYDHLNLNNGFHDPSFMREMATYMLARRYGPAPGANFVTLYLNDEYWGVYINVQQPNKDLMKEWFRSDDGNRYRGFPTQGSFRNGRCALTWLGDDIQEYIDAYEAKEGDSTDLRELCDVLNNTPDSDLQDELPNIFSVDQFYRYAAVMNLTTQTDSYIGSGKDHFLYHDPVHGAFHMFPFDVNEAFAGQHTLSPWENHHNSNLPALSQTTKFDDWRERYNAHYLNITEEAFSWEELGPIVEGLHAMIAPDVERDDKKIYTTEQFYASLTETVRVEERPGRFKDVPGMKPLVVDRNTHILGLPAFTAVRPDLSELQCTPATPTSEESVTITVQASSSAASVSLYTRTRGPFSATAMYDDGQHGDGDARDGTWGVVLSPLDPGTRVDYYVAAASDQGTLRFLPATAEFQSALYTVDWPHGAAPVVINELVAKNTNGAQDEEGQYEDWLELHNPSDASLDVAGMYLSDDPTAPTKWALPEGQTIEAGGTLLVWCDEDGSQGPLHANFKLSGGGEEVSLYDTDGTTQLASYSFGEQVDDVATGRLSDGATPWVTLSEPTPDTSNQSGCGSRHYDQLDATAHPLLLSIIGSAEIGSTLELQISGATPHEPAEIVRGLAPDYASVGTSGVRLVEEGARSWVLPANSRGSWTIQVNVPNAQGLIGRHFYVQVASAGENPGDYDFSNAAEVEICP